MLRATEITMVTSTNLSVLADDINKLLKNGSWSLHGDLKIVQEGAAKETTYIQPMVKIEMFEPGGGLGLGGMPPTLLVPRGG